MKRVLVLEDEESIRDFVVFNLQRAGYTTVEAASGEEALALIRNSEQFDLAVLDIMLPGIDGLTVCREIRSQNNTIGIIMLTAKTQEIDKVSGLMQGADDYVAKPFSPSELIARVDALHRRVESMSATVTRRKTSVLTSGEYVLDMRSRELRQAGRLIDLTQVELQMMELFFRNVGKTLLRTYILQYIWGDAYVGEDKIVDVNMRRLRMKIERDPSSPRHILTVWGQGYKWQE